MPREGRRRLTRAVLVKKEEVRRKFLKRSHGNTRQILLTWTGSALGDVVHSALFWFNILGAS